MCSKNYSILSFTNNFQNQSIHKQSTDSDQDPEFSRIIRGSMYKQLTDKII